MQALSQQDIDIDKYTVFEKKISTFLALFGILMLLASPQLFNVVPIQASQPAPKSFRTPTPAIGNDDARVALLAVLV